ncbi:MAG: sensor histidine kinase [Rhodospirillaceae bacterium]
MKLTPLKALAVAIACSLLALALRLSLNAVLGSGQAYAFALAGVALCIYLANWRVAIVNALLSAVWVNYLYVIPRYEFAHALNVPIVAGFVSYLFLAAVLIYFGARESRAHEATKRALEAADRANEAWRRADKQKDEFISVLSHELRNPLGAVWNAAIVIRARSRNRDLMPAVELLHRQLQQMRRLLDDLLDVARINRGLIELHREMQDIRGCVQNAIDANMHLVEEAQQSLDAVMPDRPVMAWVDGARITQIMSNLINNAAKYAGRGAQIEVRIEPGPDRVTLVVRDNGAGIHPELLAHLFERFPAKEKETAVLGLGLGLWISQSLASLHGGEITAASEGLGKGVQFRVCFPHGPVTASSP